MKTNLTFSQREQKGRSLAIAIQQDNDDFEARLGILGALSLYLDFINLFLFLLRLGGRKR